VLTEVLVISKNSVITNSSSPSTNSIIELGMELTEPGTELIENNESALEEEEPDELFSHAWQNGLAPLLCVLLTSTEFSGF
jgi:hypothetical protein